jgi:NAD(P)-dependent dehydrogenase (short-subunit alcohol dehydrogenase family)
MSELPWRSPEGPLPPPAERLAGRVIFVTGAAQGIGRAIAALFAAEGARVLAFDRNRQALDELAGIAGCLAVEGDVTNDASVEQAVARAVAEYGKLDGLVNAAGIHAQGSLAETSPARFREVLEINLTGPFLVCRAAAPHLLGSGGATIVNLSSASALATFPNRSAYAASKGGLITMSKSLAQELAPKVRVNVIAPGLVDTPMARGIAGHNAMNAAGARHALNRIGAVEEIAQAALFLSSPASSFVTGVTLAVDGGRTFH